MAAIALTSSSPPPSKKKKREDEDAALSPSSSVHVNVHATHIETTIPSPAHTQCGLPTKAVLLAINEEEEEEEEKTDWPRRWQPRVNTSECNNHNHHHHHYQE
mmetsp:Transcript_1395/g.1527  ORF Transcript_1395/g.1527 Transcript_1395/m.1527 type:complete len:103 (+) Transcript_1395:1214-1522(+)